MDDIKTALNVKYIIKLGQYKIWEKIYICYYFPWLKVSGGHLVADDVISQFSGVKSDEILRNFKTPKAETHEYGLKRSCTTNN